MTDIFNLPTIISFFAGVFLGFFFLFLVYIYAALKSLNKKRKIKKVQEENISEVEINYLIDESVKKYKKNKEERKEFGNLKYSINISKELATAICSKYYPKSKQPYLELTIDELLLLGKYISDRLDKLLDAKILNLIRKMTIKQILDLKKASESITNNKFVKTTIEAKPKKIYDALRLANPLFWIKKGTMDILIKVVMNRIYLSTIVIIGEETYKIYSKKVFVSDASEKLETDLEKIYEDIKKG